MMRRALEIGGAVAVAAAQGLPVAFLTLTMRHHRRQSLKLLWDSLGHSWGRVTSGRGMREDREKFGIAGYVRVVEVTYGENGWHVHVHALVFGEGLTQSNLDELGTSMWGRWEAGLRKAGLGAPLSKASDWQLVTGDLTGTKLGEYLAKGVNEKGNIGLEMTNTQSKVARTRHSTKSVWSLLDDAATGEVAPVKLWHEWENGSKGRHHIAWSQGLKDRLGLDFAEISDESIAAEVIGSAEDTVLWITASGWAEMVRRPKLIAEMLTLVETSGPVITSHFLTQQGVDHFGRNP